MGSANVTRLFYPLAPYENGQAGEAAMSVRLPAYVEAAPPRRRDYVLVALLMLVAGAVGAGAVEYAHMTRAGAPAEPSISPPAEIRLKVGEPQEVEATTPGRRVCWLALDQEIQLKPAGAKSVWVWGTRPGSYRLIAWGAAGDVPSLNASTTVLVEDAAKASAK